MDNKFIRAKILFALARKRKWGASHTAYENMLKQFKSKSLGDIGYKNAKKLADGLIKEGYIIRKPTHYGLQVSLNPRKSREIKDIIKKELGFDL